MFHLATLFVGCNLSLVFCLCLITDLYKSKKEIWWLKKLFYYSFLISSIIANIIALLLVIDVYMKVR
nr:MAG TPA: hypothetical protein [Caudoviricetes sp.]